MAKIFRAESKHPGGTRYFFICPGCNETHAVSDKWEFNRNYDRPTFVPSILATVTFRNADAIHLCATGRSSFWLIVFMNSQGKQSSYRSGIRIGKESGR
jgi:hypothetical protein